MALVLDVAELHPPAGLTEHHSAVEVAQVGLGQRGIAAARELERGRRRQQLAGNVAYGAVLIGLYPTVLERPAGIPHVRPDRKSKGSLLIVHAPRTGGRYAVAQRHAVVELADIDIIGQRIVPLHGIRRRKIPITVVVRHQGSGFFPHLALRSQQDVVHVESYGRSLHNYLIMILHFEAELPPYFTQIQLSVLCYELNRTGKKSRPYPKSHFAYPTHCFNSLLYDYQPHAPPCHSIRTVCIRIYRKSVRHAAKVTIFVGFTVWKCKKSKMTHAQAHRIDKSESAHPPSTAKKTDDYVRNHKYYDRFLSQRQEFLS